MSFPRYPKYKTSGVEWLGDVPEHWEVKPNKAFLTLRKSEVGSTWSQKTLLSLTLHGVISRDMESGKGKFPSDFSSYQDVDENDLIFCLFDMDETPRTVGLAKSSGMITGAYDVFQCRVLLARPQFILYYYLYIDAFKALRPFYTGLRKVVRPPTFLAIKIPLPPLEEQITIAAFLDHETAKIDALVWEQERLIELLKEKRQAVISHAVTKGLNPDAPMKDSGIEWLGEVPEHWEVWKLSHAFDVIGSGTTPKSDNATFYDDGETAWVNTGDLNDGDLFDCEKRVTELALAEHSSLKIFPPGSLVIAMYGATIGKLARLQFSATVNQACCVFAGGVQVRSEFLFYWFTGLRQQIISLATGGGQPNISQEILRGLRLACPTHFEQTAIATFLDHETTKINILTTEANRVIDLLKERRTALISAAVTGQIDVRNLVPVESA